jgi:SAM-dependent methyltransferase
LLGLASGGGQQGPLFAAAGTRVTIFDNSPRQLEEDRKGSDAYGLGIRTVQGDIRDLSFFPDASFDLIFNPCSILFVDRLQPAWDECYRVLRPGGILMTGLMNPLAYQIDESDLLLKYAEPYSDLHSLAQEKRDAYRKNLEPLLFGHTWTDQLGGQLKAGLRITDLFEDGWGGQHILDNYFKAFMATRAVKPA